MKDRTSVSKREAVDPPAPPAASGELQTLLAQVCEHERQLRTLVSVLPGIAYRCRNDRRWTEEFIGGTVLATTGWNEEVFTTNAVSWADLIHPDDAEMVWDVVQRAVQRREPFQLEYRILHRNGSVRWVREQGEAVFDAAGETLALEGFILDITRHKQAEQALRQSEERFRVALESAAIPFVLLHAVRNDAQRIVDFEWVYANDAAAKAYKLPLTDLIGRRVGAVQPGEWDAAGPVFELYVRVIETGRAETIEFRFEQGTLRGWFQVAAAKYGDGVSVWFADVTARRNLLQQAVATRRQLEAITSLMDAGVTRCTADLRYQWVSARYARFVGRDPDEIAGRSLREILGDAAFQKLLPKFQLVLSGQRVEYEEEVEYPRIGLRWIRAAYVPSRSPQGTVDGWVAVVTDITDRKRLEMSLVEADRRKDEFLGVLAHELRNPLAAISNATRVIQAPQASEQDRQQGTQILGRQVMHLSRLVDDLLDVARITRGQISLKKEPIAVGLLVERAMETVRPLVHARQQEVHLTLPQIPIVIDADLTRMTQVIGNLLHNSAKYSPRRSTVRLRAAIEADQAVIRVRDEGVGIDAQVLPHVFDLFHQGSQEIDREQGGLGIGLTVVRRLVELHGGTVSAYSAGPGHGSEFVVRLPLAACQPAGAQPGDAPSAQYATRKVLVVDDNADSAESLATLLRLTGHETRTAADGPAALEAFSSFAPDTVLLDIGLPKMDGYAVARALRTRYPGTAVKLLALTGYGREEDRAHAREAGFDAHLTKPVQIEQLLRMLGEGGR